MSRSQKNSEDTDNGQCRSPVNSGTAYFNAGPVVLAAARGPVDGGEPLLRAARAAIAQAGVGHAALRAGRTGVLVSGAGGTAQRIADELDLSGPVAGLDGGLAALHVGALALRAGECDFALIAATAHDGAGSLLLARRPDTGLSTSGVLAIVHQTGFGQSIADYPVPGIVGMIDVLTSGTSKLTRISESTAHVVLGPPQDAVVPWVLSAESAYGLQTTSAALAVHLEATPTAPADVGFSLLSRPPAGRRAVVVARDGVEARRGLVALATGGGAPNLVRGTASHERQPVFVFPGQGSQWEGMAVELLDTCEVFSDGIHMCADALAEFVDWSLPAVLRGEAGAPAMRRVDVLQPALWATMVSLAEVWKSHGVHPAAVVGHCYGEIAAAQVAGGLGMRDAARLVARRSKAWLRLVGKGTVVSVGISEEETTRRLPSWPDSVEIAAINGPRSVALTGPTEILDALVADLTAEGLYAKRIPGVDTVGHCSQVDVLREHLMDVLRPVSPTSSAVPFQSTVDGGPRDTATLDTGYWYHNTRSQVRFHQTVRSLLAAGHRTFLEVSPHPLLAMPIEDTAADMGVQDVAVLGTLRRGQGGLRRMMVSLAEAYTNGVNVDWSPAFHDARRVELPEAAAEPSPGEAPPALEALDDLVRTAVAEILESAGPILADATFQNLGLGSLASVRLRDRLNGATGLHLPASVAFDHPTPAALARHVHRLLSGPDLDPDTPALAALAKVEAHMASGGASERIGARLEALLDRVRRGGRAGPAAVDRFASADDEEMFALLGEKFGIC